MQKVTATHRAIQSIDNMIRDLKLHRAELASTLPRRQKFSGPMVVPDPYTGRILPQRRGAGKTKDGAS
jgi:hypothetical protein